MAAAVRGGQIGVILVTWGRASVVAFAEGEFAKGSVYAAATASSIFGTVSPETRLARFGVKGFLKSAKIGKASVAVVGIIFASYNLFLASQTTDSIRKLSHLEQASAFAVDTAIMLVPGYGTAVFLSWTVTVALMSVIIPNNIAASVMSTPGAFVTFVLEYVFGGEIPSAISDDTFQQSADTAISQMRQWNSVFQIPSIVVLPPEE